MKKLFTLLVAMVAFTSAANADGGTTQTLGFGGNAWSVNVNATGNVGLTVNTDWGEYKLTGSSFDVTKYKGFKVVYQDCVAGGAAGSFQMKITTKTTGDKNGQYVDFTEGEGTLAADFDQDKFSADPTITTFNAQGKSAGSYIKIVSASLVKTDGTEEALTFAGPSWGIDVDPLETPQLQFTGQYGGQELFVAEDGSLATYTTNATDVQSYTVEFAEPLASTLIFELDGASGSGFQWFNVDAGTSSYTFQVDATTAAQDVASIWMKANGDKTTPYPFTVNISSAKRVLTTVASGINNVSAKTENADAAVYNMAGQRVSNSYKGLIIKNGKKMIVK